MSGGGRREGKGGPGPGPLTQSSERRARDWKTRRTREQVGFQEVFLGGVPPTGTGTGCWIVGDMPCRHYDVDGLQPDLLGVASLTSQLN